MYLKAKDRTLPPRNKTARVPPHERFKTHKHLTHAHKTHLKCSQNTLETLWQPRAV
jgi:hypothetical protein